MRLVPTILLLTLVMQSGSAKPAPPVLTEIETTQIRALNYEVQRVNAFYELANAAKERADHAAADAKEHVALLKRDLEKAHPGWSVDLSTGEWTPIEKKK